LRADGRDVVFIHPDVEPVPPDLAFLLHPGEEIRSGLPADIGERTLVALDCASEKRLWEDPPPWGAAQVLNIDHHADNTGFGGLNLVVAHASSTAEIVADLLAEMDLPLSAESAEALYAGMITDTGRWTYSNTRPHTHEVAGRLIATGFDAPDVARRLFEDQPLGRVILLGRALGRAQMRADGRMMVASLDAADLASVEEPDTENIVETLRGVAGVEAAMLTREVNPGDWRVSLRTSREDVDVSAIAREEGGGGHRAAAGFSTARSPEDLFTWVESLLVAQMDG
jgi:phosphoesterase RecJ-like protein